MRINKFIAQATGLSRRSADQAIAQQRVVINGRQATPGTDVQASDHITLDNRRITPPVKTATILLHKPVGFVCSRNGQGSQTIYDLLPPSYHHLKPVGRLDKDSSGLLLLTNNGDLANLLTHPRYGKTKVYEIVLDAPLAPLHQQLINDHGVQLKDGLSQLHLLKLADNRLSWQVTMQEGRNRQIRRTFEALGYTVTSLHRTVFGEYQLNELAPGHYKTVE